VAPVTKDAPEQMIEVVQQRLGPPLPKDMFEEYVGSARSARRQSGYRVRQDELQTSAFCGILRLDPSDESGHGKAATNWGVGDTRNLRLELVFCARRANG
jgi:hypothetical protein